MEVTLHPHRAGKPDELGVASQEHMLAVIDLASGDPERGGPPSQKTAPLEELDVAPRLLELHRGRKAGHPGPDDTYAVLSHDSSATRSFSTLDSEARRRRGISGSRSIRLRIRW